jgi:hypothetical protein
MRPRFECTSVCRPRRSVSRALGRGVAACLAMASALLPLPTALFAQDNPRLPPAHQVQRDSTVDVSTLPPPVVTQEPGEATVKPFRTRDPAGLRRWRELIQQSPGIVTPAPGFVEDKRTDR